MLLLVALLLSCIGTLPAPKNGTAVISFYGWMTKNSEKMLDALKTAETEAVIFLDPLNEDFSKQDVEMILAAGQTVGLNVPETVARLADTTKNDEYLLQALIKASRQLLGPQCDAKYLPVKFNISKPLSAKGIACVKRIAEKSKLIIHNPSVDCASGIAHEELYEIIEGLEYGRGRVSLSLDGEKCSGRIVRNIISHLRQKKYKIVGVWKYMGDPRLKANKSGPYEKKNLQKNGLESIVNPKDSPKREPEVWIQMNEPKSSDSKDKKKADGNPSSGLDCAPTESKAASSSNTDNTIEAGASLGNSKIDDLSLRSAITPGADNASTEKQCLDGKCCAVCAQPAGPVAETRYIPVVQRGPSKPPAGSSTNAAGDFFKIDGLLVALAYLLL